MSGEWGGVGQGVNVRGVEVVVRRGWGGSGFPCFTGFGRRVTRPPWICFGTDEKVSSAGSCARPAPAGVSGSFRWCVLQSRPRGRGSPKSEGPYSVVTTDGGEGPGTPTGSTPCDTDGVRSRS